MIEKDIDIDLKQFKILENKYYKVYIPKNIKKPLPMLCAHTDTIFTHAPENFSMQKGRLACKDKGIGLGADDRNGCYLLHQVMLQKPSDFIFGIFDLEEQGCIGSNSFNMFTIQEFVSILIELDRKGNSDFALYGYENEDLYKLLETFPNYHVDIGSVTDVAILAEQSNICCFNLSVGFYKQHSEKEFTLVRDVERAEKFLLNLPKDFWGKQFLTDNIFWEEDLYEDHYFDPFLKKFNRNTTKLGRK
ncbi:MAG: hypothetical protein K9G38_06440 [Bacteroidales bacterium]|nr:hypothetical protein [Bacteroidales bacterium]